MRLIFFRNKLKQLFDQVKFKSNLSWQELADRLKISKRTLFDWRTGKYTISSITLNRCKSEFNIKIPKPDKILNDNWSKSLAGMKGGQKTFELYGNIGTKEGCRKGALMAIKTHRRKKSKFFVAKKINIPHCSKHLAEFIGILLGDGAITGRQIVITLNRFDDKNFAEYVKNLIKNLFFINPTESKRESVLSIIISRTKLVQFLTKDWFKIGSKVKQQIDIPKWIKENDLYAKACIRGLLDTDGCFYVDKHKYKDKIYYNCGLNFSNRSLPILLFFKNNLEKLGFHPTQNTKFSISLRKEKEILNYFKIVGSSNPKHKNKFKTYFKNRYGRVPKWL
ncbi:MAG: LAGLIDADG family homing endonuclease [Nanoarchaeota archaeon]|nr:LAGLIDADG family homing endonuclease [Nanoarchaeota archaeon]